MKKTEPNFPLKIHAPMPESEHTLDRNDQPPRVSAKGLLFWLLLFLPVVSINSQAEVDSQTVNKIVDAIYLAEGGDKTRYPYGIKSVPCHSLSDCRRIAENTVRNNHKRWIASDKSKEFIYFLADRYCPPSVDPIGNRNWKANVSKLAGSLVSHV